MLSRFLVILFFVPLLIWIFLKGDVTFLIFTEVIIGISMFEFYKMLKDKGYEVKLSTRWEITFDSKYQVVDIDD